VTDVFSNFHDHSTPTTVIELVSTTLPMNYPSLVKSLWKPGNTLDLANGRALIKCKPGT
jgi:hypothetical protein